MIKFENGKASNITIAYIGGGSTGWARAFMSDLIVEDKMSGEVRLYDIDDEASSINTKIGNMYNDVEGAKTKWDYKKVDTLESALTGADFVVISITPGTIDIEMRSDVHHPENYGILQSVGDTVGPGGYIRAARMVPMYIEFGEAIKKYSPNAWVINYTNPMTLCIRTLYEVFPEIKAFGCCHEVFGTQELLMKALEEQEGIKVNKRDDIKVEVTGINHFTWLTKASYNGKDLFPIYKEFADKHYEKGIITKGNWGNPFRNAHKVKFDLFKRYGYIAAAGDRHLIEFLPHWYMTSSEDQQKWLYTNTPVDLRVERLNEKKKSAKDLVNGLEQLEINPSGEEGIQQIMSILGLKEMTTNVNLPNKGQIPWLPLGAVVETNASFRSNQVTPIQTCKIPYSIQNLIIQHSLNQEAFINAFFNKSRQELLNVFTNDPMVKTLTYENAEKLFNEMIDNTSKFLPDWLLK